jgi:hypothetical protein
MEVLRTMRDEAIEIEHEEGGLSWSYVRIFRTVGRKASVGNPRGGEGLGGAETSREDLRATTMCQGWGTIEHELGHLEGER